MAAMPIQRSNVPGLAEPPGYTHLATVGEARLVFVAGQVPLEIDARLVLEAADRAAAIWPAD